MTRWTIRLGDALEVLRTLESSSVDSIVSDPPYGLAFMGKGWDYGIPGVPYWAEALRVAKPGAHLLAFGGTRTFHRLTCAIEDAGWEIRDCLMWLYGQGFPKSLDVSKAIDKAEDHVRGSDYKPNNTNEVYGSGMGGGRTTRTDPPVTAAAHQWSGWGTALKPAFEPIILARKPLLGNVAENVQAHGTGALNIDACRIEGGERLAIDATARITPSQFGARGGSRAAGTTTLGRWPANVVLDEAAAEALDEQSGERASGIAVMRNGGGGRIFRQPPGPGPRPDGGYTDSGGASRFFFTSKAGRDERERGPTGELHPTVKPVSLMRWLVRLVTREGGLVLDPFCGSGSTGVAALAERMRFLGIDKDAEYAEIARRRIDESTRQGSLLEVEEVER